jgi:hypothetical protein
MTWKVSANPCIERDPGHQKKKSTEGQIQFQSNDDLFFDIQGAVHTDWVLLKPGLLKEVLTTLHEQVRRK